MDFMYLQEYKGQCHCGAVQFTVQASRDLVVMRCNCSVCKMKQNHHFIVPEQQFKVTKGAENLTLYQFNTKQAKHKFCKICGVQAFYHPRSNPDGIAVTIHCIDASPASSITYEDFDGKNWEEHYAKSDIAKYSKSGAPTPKL